MLNHIRHRLAAMFATRLVSADSAKRKGLLDTSLLTVLLGAYVFFVGWSFTYVYYDALGISIAALSIPLQSYYVYAFTVFANTPPLTQLVFITLVTSAYLVTMFRPPWKFLFVPLLIALVVLSYDNARERARRTIESLTRLRPKVVLFLKNDVANEMREELKRANERGELRLITHTSDHVFVWQPPPEKQSPTERPGYTFQIPREALYGLRVQILDDRLDATKR